MGVADERFGASTAPGAGGVTGARRLSKAECRLLVELARGYAPDTTDTQWPRLLDAANRHRLIPLVAPTLQAAVLPDACQARLRTMLADAHDQQRRAQQTFAAITGEAGRRAIPFLLFKGPVLSQLAYGGPYLRSYADLDMLVRDDDLAAAEAMLRDLGFELARLRRSDLSWMLDEASARGDVTVLSEAETRRLYRAHHFHLPFAPRDAGSALRVDLHWALFRTSCRQVPPSELWQRAVPSPVDGEEVRTLSPEDTLVCLCQHVSLANYRRLHLISLLDIVRAAGALSPEQWTRALALAAAHGLEEPLLRSLWLSHRTLDCPLPAAVRRECRRGARERLLLLPLSRHALVNNDSLWAEAAWARLQGAPLAAVATRMARQATRRVAARFGMVRDDPPRYSQRDLGG